MKSSFIENKKKKMDARRKEALKKCKKCAFYDKEFKSCYGPHRLPKKPTDWEAYGEAFLESYTRRGAYDCEHFMTKRDKTACELREKNKKALNQGHERLEQIRAQEQERKRLEQERNEQERREKELQKRIEQERVARQKKLEEFNTYLARAQKGNTDSMCKVAQSYAHGYGVEKDIENAKEWFVKAFKAGNKNAEPNMRDLFGDTETDHLINPIIEERRKKQEDERARLEAEAKKEASLQEKGEGIVRKDYENGYYEGTVSSSGMPQGYGIYYYSSGSRYEGEWSNGKKNGRGTYYNVNGDKYEGQIADGVIHGQGTYCWPDGEKYVGEWRNGLKNGHGTYYRVDGTRYEGEYRDDKANGFGKLFKANGTRYEGNFVDDKPSGYGTCYYRNGNKYVGEWRNGKRNGCGTYYYTDGTACVGEWRDGKRIHNEEE